LEREKASRGRFWSLEFGGFWIWVDLVGGRKREIFLPLGARTVETAGEKRKEEKKMVWSQRFS
jgi:hypothetical protein